MATIPEALSIAIQHHQGGRRDVAALIYRQILSVDPSHCDSLHLLGVIAHQAGKYQDAIQLITQAIQLNGGATNVHNNLGEAYFGLRKVPEAVACYHRALELNPDYAVAHNNLGNALTEQSKLEDAIVSYCRALELKPDFAEAYCNLGNALLNQGRLIEADACCRRALELNPGYVEAHNNLGQVLQESGNLDDALGWYQRGLELDPRSARIHYNLARLFQDREQSAQAAEHYDRALDLVPDFADAHHGRGLVLHDLGELDHALMRYREALRLRPDFSIAHCSAGTVLLEQGHFPEAEQAFRKALQADPDCTDAYAQLATLLRGKLPESDLIAVRRLAVVPHLTDFKRSALHFGLGQVYDAQGDYSGAAEELRLANSLSLADRHRRGKEYDPEGHDRFVRDLIETFDAAYFERVAGFGPDTERPVFIMGLPRSGTTLIEQILASHSHVFGAGELGLAGATMSSLPQILSCDAPPSECARYLDGQRIREIAGQCLDRLVKLDDVAMRVTDKLPDNYLYAGLIATLFPKAKIIHCRRNLRDIAVSCWMTNFRQVHWANRFEHIASRFRAYEQLMDHWSHTLPTRILHVDYEETVSDVEVVARRLVHWCNLEWEPACAVFHEHHRPVRTASATQIRQPIYSSSVGRWKHYEQALASLFVLLPDKHVEPGRLPLQT